MNDRRKTGEGAMKGWNTRRRNQLSYDEATRLSRVFNEGANLGWDKDYRINEWLKREIGAAKRRRDALGR